MSRPASERPRVLTALSHMGVMVVVAAVLGVVVAGLAIPLAGVVGFTARSTADSVDDLPQELDTQALAQTTRILDADGELLATVWGDQRRDVVPLRQVSRTMRQAILAIEDYRFYQHGALDVRGTARALVTNLGSGGVVQGGSSITQQLVKQTLFNQADTDAERAAATAETVGRKVTELRYAIALEKKYSKDWILERYLNTVYFGDGAYGIQAAAQTYYSKDAKDLDVNQSATLAGLVQNPSAFDPTNSRDRALERRNVVLDRMAELNVIGERKARRVKGRNLFLDTQRTPQGCVSTAAPFFCSYTIEWLLQNPVLGKTRRQRSDVLNNGGLTIRTTINLDYQRAADAATSTGVGATDNAIGALAMLEPGTGDVKALSQSRPIGDDREAGETYLNYTVPKQYGNSNGFQAGSTFKAFVLAQAIEDGVELDRTYYSPDATTFNYADYDNCPGAPTFGTGTFPMQNSTDGGYENLYSGTRDSVNTFYLRLEQDTGVCDPYNLARSMGVQLTSPEAEYDEDGNLLVSAERIPNFTLGVADVSPLEMAEAYATFGARGIHCDARPVTSITDASGAIDLEIPQRCERVISQDTADAVNDILRGVIEGGFASAEALSVPAAGKTGTTGTVASSPSVWFMGYTPNLATASMVAGANEFGTPLGLAEVTINGFTPSVSGSTLAAPIWGDAMQAIDDTLPDEDFVFPSNVPGAGVESAYTPPPPSSPAPPPSTNGGGTNGRGR